MKKHFYHGLLIVSLLLLTGCNFMFHILFGMNDPHLESSNSLKAFAEECHFQKENLFHIDSTYGFAGFRYFNRMGLPGIRIYNKDGDMIKILRREECPHTLSRTIRSLVPGTTFDTLVKGKLDADLRRLRKLDETKVPFRELPPADYYVLILTAKYLGKKIQKYNVIEWQDSIFANAHSRINLMCLFSDFHDSWNPAQLDSLREKRILK